MAWLKQQWKKAKRKKSEQYREISPVILNEIVAI